MNAILTKSRQHPQTPVNLKRAAQIFIILALLCGILLPTPKTVQAWTIPTFDVIAVNPDTSVTVRTFNFPANQLFTVRMGAFGTLGIGGTVVATTNSGAGGSFEETYTIPASLVGSARIAIRLDSPDGFFSYNWFDNKVSSATPVPGGATATPAPGTGSVTIPTFSITGVAAGTSVTIQTNNFPSNQNFKVTMGSFGSLGIGGTEVTTTNSGAGGAFVETYNIPADLASKTQIAIRLESPAGFFAYNWFWNTASSDTGTTPVATTPVPGGTTFTGIPTFMITDVVGDSTVTIQTNNFPANTDFSVLMGTYGSLGIGGTKVGTTNSGAGGALSTTYNIPDALKGKQKIAIRLESASGFFAYNWFWNSTSGSTSETSPTQASTSVPDTTKTPTPTATPVAIPTFIITSVAADTSVTIQTNNFPANTDFKVTMGDFGTLAIGGTEITTTNSGAGGAFNATYTIPDNLKGKQKIALRLESSSGFFAYNWFWNSTAP